MKHVECSGGIFLAKNTGRFLFLHRSATVSPDTWGIAGGKKEPCDTTPYDTLLREIHEEIGCTPEVDKVVPIDWYQSDDDRFCYHTYVLIVPTEFIPTLNHEHSGYCWVANDKWPKPLHTGLRITLASKTTRAKLQTILALI